MKPTWNDRKRQYQETQQEASAGSQAAEDPPVDVPDGDASVVGFDAPIFDQGPVDSDEDGVATPVLEDNDSGGALPYAARDPDDLEEEGAPPEVELPEVAPVERPSLEQYQAKWACLLYTSPSPRDRG